MCSSHHGCVTHYLKTKWLKIATFILFLNLQQGQASVHFHMSQILLPAYAGTAWRLGTESAESSPIWQLLLAVSWGCSFLARGVWVPRKASWEGEPGGSPTPLCPSLRSHTVSLLPYSIHQGSGKALPVFSKRRNRQPLLGVGRKVLEQHAVLERVLWPFLEDTICQNVNLISLSLFFF